MAEPIARKRKDGSVAWYSRVKMADGSWTSERLRAATDKSSARKLNHQMQEAEDKRAKGLAGGAAWVGTFAELCDFAWKHHLSGLTGAKEEASRLHVHGGAVADREGPGPSPLGPLLASKVDSGRLEEYFSGLATTPSAARGKPLSSGAINRIRATFSTVFTTAQRFKRWPADDNPAASTLERTVRKKRIRTLAKDQILRVLEFAGDYWDGPFAVCLLAGLRRSEMLSLLKIDVDLERGLIFVRSSGDEETTKGDRHDGLPIHPELRPYLERWLESPGPFMFPNHDGEQRTTAQRFDLRLQAAMVRAGIVDHFEHRCRCKECPLRRHDVKRGGHLERHDDDAPRRCEGCGTKLLCTPKAPKINFHATRHSFATAALESGASIQGVQALMRHSDPRLTIKTYGHLAPTYLKSEVDRINLRGEANAGEGKPARAKGAKAGAWVTNQRNGAPTATHGLATPVRRGVVGASRGGSSDSETSMKTALGIVEPTGIEPVTYALRKQNPDDGDAHHGSQTIGTVSEFSPRRRGSPSQRSLGNAPVRGGLATPVRRGRAAATQAVELQQDMLEPVAATLPDARQPSATVLLPVAEVARRLGVSQKWVRRRVELGELDVVRVGGTRLRVTEPELEAFIQRSQG